MVMTPTESLALLHRLRDAHAGGWPLSADDSGEVAAMLDCYIEYRCPSLDCAFLLPSVTERRNLVLHDAADRHVPGDSIDPRARQLESAFARYRAGPWERAREAESCPHDVDSLHGAFWRALRLRPVGLSFESWRAILRHS